MNNKKAYNSLRTVHQIKRKEVKKFLRKGREDPEVKKRELGMYFGTVWGINDKSVPFDAKRKLEEVKEALRPCLALDSPDSFDDNSLVSVAPGTTIFHPVGADFPPCLRADVPPEELTKTTYFLLYLRWDSVQRKAEKKYCDLSTGLKRILQKIV